MRVGALATLKANRQLGVPPEAAGAAAPAGAGPASDHRVRGRSRPLFSRCLQALCLKGVPVWSAGLTVLGQQDKLGLHLRSQPLCQHVERAKADQAPIPCQLLSSCLKPARRPECASTRSACAADRGARVRGRRCSACGRGQRGGRRRRAQCCQRAAAAPDAAAATAAWLRAVAAAARCSSPCLRAWTAGTPFEGPGYGRGQLQRAAAAPAGEPGPPGLHFRL